jgi:MinD-like ATPase involved in chromosome partitioning or flagellar assembly
MSGPHQPGWSDEELISLADLHLSRKSLGVQSSESRSRDQPARSQSQKGRPAARTTQREQAPRSARSSGDQTRKAPHSKRTAAQQQHAQVPAQKQRSTHAGAQVPSRSSHTADSRHSATSPARATPARAQVSREPENPRHELNLRKLLPAGLREKAGVNERLLEQVRFPLRDARVGVFSRKGGVGKTTITAYLGLTLADLRHRPIVAVDGDSEAGSLGWLLAPNAPTTLDALASAQPMPTSRDEFRRYVAHTKSGVDVVLGDTGECAPISEKGLRHAVRNLANSYDMSLYDTGSGVTHSAGRALINSSRVLLLVMGTSVDSVRAAERTLAWLDERDDATTPPTAVIAVVNGIPAHMKLSQIQQIEQLFADRCAAVVRIPFDEHLAGGTTSADLALLTKPTQQAFHHLAATTVKVLARSTPLRVNREREHA